MATLSHAPQTTALGSWKEIAKYLGKGVRTVQRWERDLGLPVRRHQGRPSGVVQAFPNELDDWLTNRWCKPCTPQPAVVTETRRELSLCRREIEAALALREASRQYRTELRHAASSVRRQCQLLRQRVTGFPGHGQMGNGAGAHSQTGPGHAA